MTWSRISAMVGEMNLYFAYGPNLDKERMRECCPSAEPASRAVLKNYKLDFTRYSPRTGGGLADVVPATGEEVWGGVYRLSDQDLDALDLQEGCPVLYRRTRVSVESDDGAILHAWTYEIVHKRSYVPPTEGQLEQLSECAADWGLPTEYCAALAEFEHEEEHEH